MRVVSGYSYDPDAHTFSAAEQEKITKQFKISLTPTDFLKIGRALSSTEETWRSRRNAPQKNDVVAAIERFISGCQEISAFLASETVANTLIQHIAIDSRGAHLRDRVLADLEVIEFYGTKALRKAANLKTLKSGQDTEHLGVLLDMLSPIVAGQGKPISYVSERNKRRAWLADFACEVHQKLPAPAKRDVNAFLAKLKQRRRKG